MEVSAIANSPVQQKKQPAKSSVLRTAVGGATIGAAVNGIKSFVSQKSILKNGDVYIKQITDAMEQTTEPALKEHLKTVAEATENYVKRGKVDIKAVGSMALKGALMFGVVFAGVELISRAFRKGKAKAAQPKQV